MASNTNYFEDLGSEMYEDDIQVVDNMNTLSIRKRVSKIDLFKKPERLIYTDDNELLEIDGNVLSALSGIDKTINVVGVCGSYRTGKSYLMNCIAGEKK
ncbi:guanylate-binding protein 3-like, partial [Mercenaria mercenaria]